MNNRSVELVELVYDPKDIVDDLTEEISEI